MSELRAVKTVCTTIRVQKQAQGSKEKSKSVDELMEQLNGSR